MSRLEVRRLTVQYGEKRIVDDVSFTLSEGEWLMLLGPNGAGKSTIVNAVSQCAPYRGEVLLNGQNAARLKSAALARQMGVLRQNQAVNYAFTVEEVVRLGRYAHRRGLFSGASEADERAVEEALRQTGLREKRNQSVLTLSGGELQRAFLAQVFAQEPAMLLLDEPGNHLDLLYQKQVFSLVREWLTQKGRAVLSVVHDLSLARAYGTDAILLNEGKTVAAGPIDGVFAPGRLNPVYGMDVRAWMQELLRLWQ